MKFRNSKEKTILIVDDVDINRAILAEIFQKDYNILEATDGDHAISIINSSMNLSAVLLDLLMPKVNGLEVLKFMNQNGRIQDIPVFLITAANQEEMLLKGYNLGAIDVISKPFMVHFLKRRVDNVIELYSHKNQLQEKVKEQIKKLNFINQSMVETLATIIEFRDGESGEHVRRICSLTGILMQEVSRCYPEYYLSEQEMDKIVTASILHDVGKISIPDSILNKPARLTSEEFEIMKLHTVKGCEILQNIPDMLDKGVYCYAYDICRHHHERWDGRGYPDHLSGDNISIWSQVVSVADVYDALTSKRVYKNAYSHKTAVSMMMNGECGTFNPKVMNAFLSTQDKIKKEE